MPIHSFGIAWVVFALALAARVADEARHGFLSSVSSIPAWDRPSLPASPKTAWDTRSRRNSLSANSPPPDSKSRQSKTPGPPPTGIIRCTASAFRKPTS